VDEVTGAQDGALGRQGKRQSSVGGLHSPDPFHGAIDDPANDSSKNRRAFSVVDLGWTSSTLLAAIVLTLSIPIVYGVLVWYAPDNRQRPSDERIPA
jgi:hypothetical protein